MDTLTNLFKEGAQYGATHFIIVDATYPPAPGKYVEWFFPGDDPAKTRAVLKAQQMTYPSEIFDLSKPVEEYVARLGEYP